jgi:hypothetical protein
MGQEIPTSCSAFGGMSGLRIDVIGNPDFRLALIYGYAFEGHCYKLDKPTITVVELDGAPAVGCDYNDFGDGVQATERYRMWVVKKLDRTVQIEVTQGFFEQLILEANLPGRRSPNTYTSNMVLSHRSGRLSE